MTLLSRLWRPARPARVDEARWVVVDLETTGLDPARDALVAIGAVAVRIDRVTRQASILPGDSFESIVRPEHLSADRANILLHGIGWQRQREGRPAGTALADFAAYVGASPLLAFHAAFDREVLQRALRSQRAPELANPWADIEFLCAVTFGEIPGGTLDAWLEHFGLHCPRRHEATADALAEAELLLRVWPRLRAECAGWDDVVRLARRRQWLRR
ncbi:3'-5' exonuclease [Caenimonas sedimenti]|uniref:3'-5' exonuclease n=1 Tax=Caenimonas sedimenti TaxID=2596921 RepID=A0A562ZPI4_9BURK|nr:3'-5' exonuclease [Caenimonas sedimenti]TWO70480.1 3'-5' exonuclease [Caenimonas sedimenti]